MRYGFQYSLPTKKTLLSHCPPLKTEQLKVKGFRVKLIRTLCSMLWGKSVHRGLLLHWLSSYSIHVNYSNMDLGSRYCRHPNMITSLHPVLQSIDITRRTLTLITLWAPHLFGIIFPRPNIHHCTIVPPWKRVNCTAQNSSSEKN